MVISLSMGFEFKQRRLILASPSAPASPGDLPVMMTKLSLKSPPLPPEPPDPPDPPVIIPGNSTPHYTHKTINCMLSRTISLDPIDTRSRSCDCSRWVMLPSPSRFSLCPWTRDFVSLSHGRSFLCSPPSRSQRSHILYRGLDLHSPVSHGSLVKPSSFFPLELFVHSVSDQCTKSEPPDMHRTPSPIVTVPRSTSFLHQV
ncbi:hypothetical protein AALP_AA7G047200 [Arabis alpina]|uniref:Uncharacterized protein n=1 Tax=Arabis alpina TaxID=50452 RepID=A0A087GFY0_ARAAL|nr:hypothetical protein AALP_AA7G047200 [Arabis alpina]